MRKALISILAIHHSHFSVAVYIANLLSGQAYLPLFCSSLLGYMASRPSPGHVPPSDQSDDWAPHDDEDNDKDV